MGCGNKSNQPGRRAPLFRGPDRRECAQLSLYIHRENLANGTLWKAPTDISPCAVSDPLCQSSIATRSFFAPAVMNGPFKAYPAALAGSGSRFADRSVDPQWCLGPAEGQHAALRGLDVQSWGEPRQGHIWRQLRNSSPPPIVKYYNVALSFVHRV